MNHKYINKETFEIVDNVFEVDEDISQTISILNKKRILYEILLFWTCKGS